MQEAEQQRLVESLPDAVVIHHNFENHTARASDACPEEIQKQVRYPNHNCCPGDARVASRSDNKMPRDTRPYKLQFYSEALTNSKTLSLRPRGLTSQQALDSVCCARQHAGTVATRTKDTQITVTLISFG
jgi:hypothetical protein